MAEIRGSKGPAPDHIVTRWIGVDYLSDIDVYEKQGGYQAWKKALTEMGPADIANEVKVSGLRGRGGAGFPTGTKWGFMPPPDGGPRFVVVNADESEPGTAKDRYLMENNPHQLIEGILIACKAISAQQAWIYIRGEYDLQHGIVQRAINQAREKGYIGPKPFGVDYPLDIRMFRGHGAYICGEETALLESLEGKRGQPRPRPPFPPITGLYSAPTQINNVQTIATVPLIIAMGAENYAKIGPEKSPGTAVYSISGNVANPGNYELELGTTLRTLIYDVGGGVAGGRELKGVIPGGSSTPILTPDQLDTPMDYESIAAAGSFFGSAAIIVIDDRCCMVQFALRAAKFYMHESCGKCTPCREGTRWMVQLLEKIESGRAEQADLDLLLSVCDGILGKSLCALGDFAVYSASSITKKYAAEFQAHVDGGGCPFEESSLERILAPIDQHTHHPTVEVPA